MKTVRVALFLAGKSIFKTNIWLSIMTSIMLVLVFLNLVFTPSLLEGVISKANTQLRQTLSSDITIESSTPGAFIDDTKKLEEKILALDGVEVATSTRTLSAQIELGSERGTAEVSGIDLATFSQVYSIPRSMIEGTFLANDDGSEIVLGAQIAGAGKAKLELYADSLKNAHAGNEVTLKFANGVKKKYSVRGIYQTEFIQADLKTLITDKEFDKILPLSKGKASAINVKLKPGANLGLINSQIQNLYGNIKTRTWQERAGFIKSYTDSVQIVNRILRTVAVFVGFLTIFIITYVDVVNKRRQIGISRAVGISPATILLTYILRALFYTVIGVTIGVTIFLFAVVPLEARHPFSFPLGDVLLSVNPSFMVRNGILLFGVSALSAFLASWRVVKNRIVEAIWGV